MAEQAVTAGALSSPTTPPTPATPATPATPKPPSSTQRSSAVCDGPRRCVSMQHSLVWRLPNSTIEVYGDSWASARTAFAVPALGMQLDCGFRPHPAHPACVFLTHVHGDHSGNLNNTISRRVLPQFYVPANELAVTERMLDAFVAFRLHGQRIDDAQMLATYQLHGVVPTLSIGADRPVPRAADDARASAAGTAGTASVTAATTAATTAALPATATATATSSKATASASRVVVDAPLEAGRWLALPAKSMRNRFVEVFEMDHSVPCVGYGFAERRKKLRPEFVGRSGKELGALRRAGVEFESVEYVPQLAFLGDTTVCAFGAADSEQRRRLLSYPVLFVECTFLGIHAADDDGAERAERKKHVFWPSLRPIVASAPHTLFVLIHFSLRYSPHRVRTFFDDERRRYGLDNVMPWVPGADDVRCVVPSHERNADGTSLADAEVDADE